MLKALRCLSSLLLSLLIAIAIGSTQPAFAYPYCDASSGPEPDCASVVCVSAPDPGETLEVNETFEVQGYVTPSQCPADYPTPNYIQLCFPYGYSYGGRSCDPELVEVHGNSTWSSLQVLEEAGEREIVSTGFYGPNRVTRQNRMPIAAVN